MMKYLFVIIIALAVSQTAQASTDVLASTKTSLRDQAFVVETSEADAEDSIDRISGNIDLGLAAPENTYHSTSHGRAGALEGSEAHDRAAQDNSYAF